MLAPLSGNTGKVIESIFIELKWPGVIEANISLLDVGKAGVYVSFVGLCLICAINSMLLTDVW